MQTHIADSFGWADLSARDSLPTEIDALGAHIRSCNGSRSRWFTVQSLGDLAHAFLAPRFVTTLGIAAVGFAVIAAFT